MYQRSIFSLYSLLQSIYCDVQDVSEDLSHSDTRLSVQLNGFELHTYNRSGLYRDLEEKFGLEPGIMPENKDDNQDNTFGGDGIEEEADPDMDSTEYVLGKNWRDLIPVIKVRNKLMVCQKCI